MQPTAIAIGLILYQEKFNHLRSLEFFNDFDYVSNQMGINVKLNEYQCAVAFTLLHTIDDVLAHRIEMFNLYKMHLSDHV